MKRTATIVTLAIAISLGLAFVLRSQGSTAASVTTLVPSEVGTSTTGGLQPAFYLAVGASGSLGYQPMGRDHGREHATKLSYTNDLVGIEAKRGVQLSLYQIGCPGETMASMLTAVDHCFPTTNGQLAQAVRFLKDHASETGLVTIDLGFNDVRKCLTRPTIDQVCADAGLAGVRDSMAKVLATLRAAAGPHVQFVGLLIDDPFLQHYLNGASGRADSAFTLRTTLTLNQILSSNYAAAKIPVADVETAFNTKNQTPTQLSGVGSVPTNVETVCQLTWMCKKAPWGPDDHPNEAGFLVIANAVESKLTAPL